jgi:RHS repeat-associated protein
LSNSNLPALLLLDPSARGALSVTGLGGAQVTGGGALVIDSANAQAAVAAGQGNVSATEIDIAGNPGFVATGSGTFQGVIHSGVAPSADPLAGLPAPQPPAQTFGAVNYTGAGPLTLLPGTYVGGITVVGQGSVTLLPGLYYLKGGGFAVTGQGGVSGDGVVIYNDGGAGISFTGTGNVRLTPPTAGTYQDITVFQNRSSAAPISLAGGGNVNITGTVYAPAATLNLTGDGGLASPAAAGTINEYVLYDLKVAGNGGFTADASYNQSLALTVGLSPAPKFLADGTPVTNASQSVVSGRTRPGAQVDLETGSDGLFDDGHTTADAAGHYSFAVTLAEGPNVLQVRATSRFDQQVIASAKVTLDTVPPTITGSRSPAANADGWNNTNVVVSFAASDNLALASVSGPVTLSGEGAGQSVTGTAFDVAGNSASTTVGGINIDKTAPATAATPSGTAGLSGWYVGPVTVALAATDNLAGVRATYYALDGGTALAYGGPILVSGDGAHTLSYWSIDRADNEETHHSLTVRIDTTPPALTVASPAPGLLTNHNVTVTGQVTDATSGVAALTAQVDGGPVANVPFDGQTGAFSYTTGLPVDHTADGSHTVHLVGTDVAGNVSTRDVTFTLDTVSPTVTVTSPAPGVLVNHNVIVSGVAVDDRTGVALLEAAVDGGAYSPVRVRFAGTFTLTTSLPLDGTADGPHTVHLRATDGAGNVSPTADLPFTLDTVPPVVSISSPGPGHTFQANPTVTGQVTDDRSGVASLEEALDGAAFAPLSFDGAGNFSLTTNLPLDGTADGPHTVHLLATDRAGNLSPVSDLPFTLTTIPPWERFGDWTPGQTGGSPAGHGTVDLPARGATLHEGDSFDVTLRHTFVVPSQPSVLTFVYSNLAFDATVPGQPQDAFEAAFVDANGNSLVHTIAGNRDAFFNVSEGQAPATGAEAAVSGQTVTLDLSQITPGTIATLIFRLVNNDGAGDSSVTLDSVRVTPGPGGGSPAAPPAATPAPAAIDFTRLSDVTPSVQTVYGRTSLDEQTKVFYAELSAKNAGQYPVDAPLVAVIEHLSDPTVRVRGADGLTPDGQPYYDFSGLVSGGKLAAGAGTGSRALSFYDPNGAPFTYDVAFLGQLNRAPVFTTTPNTEALVGHPYAYSAAASDPDGDALTFSLQSGPAGMSVDPATGKVTWGPQAGDLGNQAVDLRVADGRGGVADQRYTVSAIVAPPNRPPVFTSSPVVNANVGTPYSYQATATDPDGTKPSDPTGETLTFSVVSGPPGLTIDPASGLVRWTPSASPLGATTLYVTSGNPNGIQKVDLATNTVTNVLATSPGVDSLIFDKSGRLIYTLFGTAQVGIYDPQTGSNTLISSGLFTSGIRDIALNPDGNSALVIDYTNNAIDRVDLTTDAVNTFASGISVPLGIAYDQKGNLFIDSAGLDSLLQLDTTGAILQTIPLHSNGRPDGMTFDPYTGALWIADNSGGLIEVSNYLTSPQVREFVSPLPVTGIFDGISSDGLGHLFFAELDSRVDNYDIASNKFTALTSVFLDDVAPLIGPGSPLSNAVTIQVSDGRGGTATQAYTINVQPQLGNLSPTIISKPITQAILGTNYSYLVRAIDPDADSLRYSLAAAPAGAAINAQSGQITWNPPAAGAYSFTVKADDGRGGFDTQSFAVNVTTAAPGSIQGTVFNDLNGNGVRDSRLLVADNTADTGATGDILSYDGNTGQFLGTLVTHGSGGMDAPNGFVLGPDGNLYVGTFNVPSAVWRFNAQTGAFIDQFVPYGSGGLNGATALMFGPDGNLYVVSSWNGSVLRYNGQTGAFIDAFVPSGSGGLADAAGAAFGPDGNLYVASTLGFVNRYDGRTGAFIDRFVPNNSGGLSVPQQIQFGKDGNLYVADLSQSLINRYDGKTGAFLGTFISGGGLSGATTFVIGSDGDFYVSSRQTHSILRYDGTTGAFEGVFIPPDSGGLTRPAGLDFALEPGLANRVVYLDLNHDGHLDPGDPFTTTDANGQYSFGNLAPGTYTVAEVGQPGWRQTDPASGTYTATVQAGQTVSGLDFGNTQLNPPGNRPPKIVSTPPNQATVGQRYQYPAVLDNPDGQGLTFDLPVHPAGMVVDPATGVVAWAPTADELGTQDVLLRVRDPRGDVDLQQFQITVGTNLPPEIVSQPVTTAVSGQTYQYPVKAIDADNDPLTYSLQAGPQGMTIDPASGHITWNVPSGGGNSSGPPPSDGLTLTAAGAAAGFSLTDFARGFPNETNGGPLGIAFTNGGVLVADVDANINGNVRHFPTDTDGQDASSEPVAQYYGSGNAIGMAQVGGNVYMTQQFRGEVVQINADGTFARDIAGVMHATGIVTDPVNGHLFVTGEAGPTYTDAIFDVDPVAKTATLFLGGLPGADGLTMNASATVLYVAVLSGGGHILGFDTRTKAQLFDSGAINGVDGTSVGYGSLAGFIFANTNYGEVWQVDLGNPANKVLIASGGTRGDFITVDPNDGTLLLTQSSNIVRLHPPAGASFAQYQVTVRVDDGRGGSDTQKYTLLVVPDTKNQAPTIYSRPGTTVGLGQTYRYAVQAADLDGDPLTYSLTAAPAGMTIDRATGLVQWTPTAAQFGPNAVTVHVDDGRGGTADQSFTVQVVTQPVTHPPSITSTPPSAATVGSLYAYNATGIDPDGTPLVWSLDTAPLGMAIDPTTGRLRWAPTADQLGNQNVVLRLTNGEGLSVTQTFSVTVRGVNVPPVITSEPPTQASVAAAYSYAVRATDADNDPLTFSLTAGPAGMTVNPATGLIQWTPTAAQVGPQAVVLRVDDGRGGFALQSFTAVVAATAPNLPPAITSVPPQAATVGQAYQYAVTATDPDGDPVHFALTAAPAGMSIDANTGLLQWAPTAAQAGSAPVTVVAADNRGGSGTQSFTLPVTVNQPPVINSTAPATVTAGAAYRYDVQATDADGDPLNYALTAGPTGMTLDSSGRLRWSPGIPDVGTAHVSLTVADGRGASVSQSFDVTVQADTQAPKVQLTLSANPANIGSQVTFVVNATDNVGVTALSLTVGGTHVALDTTGRATVTMSTAGDVSVVATATDAAGNVGTASGTLTVIDPRVTNPPTVSFDSPADGAVVTAPTDVIGTVSDSSLLYYTLSIAPVGSSSFTEIARGTNPVSHGVLGRFDPSLLSNDSYDLRLYAKNAGGLASTTDQTVSVAGGLKLGNFRLSFTDLTVPVSGIPITVTRTYDSLDAANSEDFGYGWRLEFRDTDLRTSVAPTGLEADGFYNPFRDGTRVYLTLPGGKREGFTFHPTLAPGLKGALLGIYTPSFTPDAGVTDQLSVPSVDLELSLDGTVSAYGAGVAYNPASPAFDGNYFVTTKDGLSYQIDRNTGQLLTASDAHGNTLTFSPGGIVSSAGPQVTFDRDPQGRIVAVIDPAGNKIAYQYDAAGNLIAVTDRAGNTTQFVYAAPQPHYLTQVIDPLGRSGVRTNYDAQGRLVTMTDAAGKAVSLSYDPTDSTEVVKDQLGNPTTYVYDDRGNIVAEVDALGGVTKRTYDLNNNLLSETDPLGRTTSYTYDALGDVLTETDPLGNVTRHTYWTLDVQTGYGRQFIALGGIPPQTPPFFQRLHLDATTTDPLGNTTTNGYDGEGNLLSTTDPLGHSTSFGYGAGGNPTSLTDANGNTTSFAYDGAGHLLRQTDALGNVTSYTYDANGNELTETRTLTTPAGKRTLVTTYGHDANGRVTSVTDPEGGVTRTAYDAAGNRTATVGPLGHTTQYKYDDRGELTATVYPDGTTTGAEYDAAGHQTATIDELGRRTTYQYDALGRRDKTTNPDGTTTSTAYDAAGQVTATIDERGNQTTFTYDAAGNQTAVKDALGDVLGSTYDAAGRLVAQTDPLGHTTRFVLDAAGRQVETDYADGTKTSVAFDAAGRAVARTDQLGRTTRYEYDALGRLTAVVDPLGQRTEYGYDEAGDLVSQKDANGHVTRYEYNGLGRRTATVLPLGQRSTTAYDAAGDTVATTDFNGNVVQYQYDSRNRLTATLFPDSTSVTYTYTADGQRATVTDARGLTAYAYDARDRLVKRTDPDGTFIAYAYDAAGNRTSVTTPAGTAAYTFDALNRTATVKGPDGGLTSYTYDAAGNLTETDLANGTKEVRQYDLLNRLTYLENDGPSGVISSYRYTLGPTGRRDAVVEDTGRRVGYSYDALDRLTREAITDAVFGNPTIDYTYDAVGNRLSMNDSAQGLTAYTYDANDRLLTEALGSQVTQYAYDANGNTLSKVTSATDQAFYHWDFQNRMVSADVTSGTGTQHTDYRYDADGIRVSQTSGGVETRYLIDTVQPYAQVLLEYRPGGLVVASYVYGNGLISQSRGGVLSYYQKDGLGSTRALTNASGVVTDRYVYDAFGRTIGQTGSTVNSYLFAGQQRDAATGLDYLRARYMSVSAGRFISRDSFEGVLKDPLTLQRYVYGGADPVNHTDPSGFQYDLGSVMAAISIQDNLQSIGLPSTTLNGASSIQLGILAMLIRITVVHPALVQLQAQVPSLAIHSEGAENLLVGTAIQESVINGVIHRRQAGGGPALGMFQMEPFTHDDLYRSYLQYRPLLRAGVESFLIPGIKPVQQLEFNDQYAAVMALVKYMQSARSLPIPAASDTPGMAFYWKAFYNTFSAQTSFQPFADKYRAAGLGN